MVQLQILNKILKSKSVDIVIENDLTDGHFGEYATEFNFIMDHYKLYGNVPDIETMLDHFNEFSVIDVTESDKYLVDQINEDFQYRQVVPILNKAAELAQSNSIETVDYLRSALQTLGVLSSECGVDIIAQAGIRLEEYKIRRDSTEPWMRPTGFKELDDIIGGLAPGEELVVIVARTNNGKSWVLCKMLEHNWRMGANVGYISPEMSASSVGYRFDTLNEHFSNFNLYTGRTEGVDNYENYINDLINNQKNKFIVATPMDFNKKITVSKLRTFCITNKIDVLGIDGITYMTDERYKRGDNKTTSLTNISEDLMSLSCELKIPILVVVQANRNGVEEDGSAPQLESIRDSDGIAHNATKVISVRQRNNKLSMELPKNRNGKVGVKLVYDWQIDTGVFEYNASPEEYSEVERPQSRYTGNQQPVENKQPIVARRGSNQTPF